MNILDTILGSSKSRTNWTAVGIALLTALNEPVQQWIAAHPGKAGSYVALIMVVLRTMTTTSLADKA
jgi:hypothetical protein